MVPNVVIKTQTFIREFLALNPGRIACYSQQQHSCSYSVRLEYLDSTERSESRCALRLRYVDLVASIEVAVEVCCCFIVFSC
jgi:hypothetical protein